MMTGSFINRIMKQCSLVFFVYFFISCNGTGGGGGTTPPNLLVPRNSPDLHRMGIEWRYKGMLFTGYIIQRQNDSSIISSVPVINGRENGIATIFYKNGIKRIEESIVNEQLDGRYNEWWRNGNYRYRFNYKNNLYDGVQIVFFADGKIREESIYANGVLEGLQRVWDDSGRLVSNYTIKNKKIYGVISVKSCMPGAEH